MLRRLAPREVAAEKRPPVDASTLRESAVIVAEVAEQGDGAIRRYAERFDGLGPGAPLRLEREELAAALAAIGPEDRALLERTTERIAAFALAQREALGAVEIAVAGGRAGHTVDPVARAGCYAPGGRYPLPSSVLMTAVTARVAGVSEVLVATPRPGPLMLAAAAIAGADAVLPLGGAHAIAAMAYGSASIPRVDVIAGPGNAWVTAAKQLVVGRVGIDMLAGPSELLVLADASADAELVAADLLAQAEHDPLALPMLVSTAAELLTAVDRALARQLAALPPPSRPIAEQALAGGFAVCCRDLDEAAGVSDLLAPEHLELMVAEPEALASRFHHYGALFLGSAAAEVLGDYGAGPNHVLPTGGSARHGGGLSVATFLRTRTWIRVDDRAAAAPLYRDAVRLARLEGLEAHARAAEGRLGGYGPGPESSGLGR